MSPARRPALAAAGVAGAAVAFAATFRGPRRRFWSRMTRTGLLLTGVALAGDPRLRRPTVRTRDLATGAAAAATLYGVFWVGDRVARRVMPHGGADIAEIYALRTLQSPGIIALRLAVVIAPAEELFWRGLVQRSLADRYGRPRGALLATAAYGGVHVVAGNPTLLGAAFVAGGFWSALEAAGVPMAALVSSHVLWDLYTFLVRPTDGIDRDGPPALR